MRSEYFWEKSMECTTKNEYSGLYYLWVWLYKVSRIISEAEICEGASAIGPNNLCSSRHHEPLFFSGGLKLFLKI